MITLTAEHDTTSPSISIPASASAVLAAIEPAATQPSIPSFSIILTNTSILDFGNSSRRTEASRACCICVAIDLSSASWQGQFQVSLKTKVKNPSSFLTRIGARRRLQENGVNLTSTFNLPFSLYVVLFDCRGPYLSYNLFSSQVREKKGGLKDVQNESTYTAHAILVLSVSIYAEPFAWLMSPGSKSTRGK
jgi:hypothetical protein